MTAYVSRLAAELVQQEIRSALGMPHLRVIDTLIEQGSIVIRDDHPGQKAHSPARSRKSGSAPHSMPQPSMKTVR